MRKQIYPCDKWLYICTLPVNQVFWSGLEHAQDSPVLKKKKKKKNRKRETLTLPAPPLQAPLSSIFTAAFLKTFVYTH